MVINGADLQKLSIFGHVMDLGFITNQKFYAPDPSHTVDRFESPAKLFFIAEAAVIWLYFFIAEIVVIWLYFYLIPEGAVIVLHFSLNAEVTVI